MRFVLVSFVAVCAVSRSLAFVPQSRAVPHASTRSYASAEDQWARLTEAVITPSSSSASSPFTKSPAGGGSLLDSISSAASAPTKTTDAEISSSLQKLVEKISEPVTASSPPPANAGSAIGGNSAQFLPDLAQQIGTYRSNVGQMIQSFVDKIQSPATALPHVDKTVGVVDLTALYSTFQLLPLWERVGISVAPVLLTAFLTIYALSFPADKYRAGLEPYSRGQYDPIQAKAFYARNRMVVLQRTLQIVRLSNKFILELLWDKYVTKQEEANRAKRADELLELITALGPTAIKIGQALSVRPDIIPTEYANSLSSLQDQVPPFSSEDARDMLKRELGITKFDRIQGIKTAEPVASASIGQVYKAVISEPVPGASSMKSRTVAVKVQRPNVLADIALDLHIVRELAPLYQKYIARSSTDLQALANEWGRGFINELDYREEAANTIRFNEEMRKRSLTAVTSPIVIEEYSTEQILVTEWVDGVRIDRCTDKEDIPRLCSVALNAYLVMLLETRSLHCDPHPGNLLRTSDGKLCILDFGMTLEVNPDLQYSLLEYIAHITSDNYDEVPEDLVKMGFLKPDKLEFARRSGLLDPLVYFLKQAGQGGGAKGVRERIIADFRARYPGLDDKELQKAARDEMQAQMQEMARKESAVTGITTEVEELQKRNRDSFTIPPWFVYTSRAFGTLEGVSLQANENYSLVQSCFPYIARRLVEDQSPRSQKALKDLIYGAGDKIDVKRLGDLADGFSTYTTTTKSINSAANGAAPALPTGINEKSQLEKPDSKAKLVQAETAITLAKDSADIILSPNGNLVQTLLIEEGTLAASAGFKDQVRDAFVDGPRKFRDSLPFGVGSFLPPLPTEAVAPFVRKTDDEEKAQQLVKKLSSLVPQSPHAEDNNGQPRSSSINTQALNAALGDLDPEQSALLVKELRENLPTYTPLVRRLGDRFISALLVCSIQIPRKGGFELQNPNALSFYLRSSNPRIVSFVPNGVVLRKASENIDSTLSDMEHSKQSDQLLRVAAKGLSNAARTGASRLEESTNGSAKKPVDESSTKTTLSR